MNYKIKEVTYNNPDFISLCKNLDKTQNLMIPERISFGFSSLKGLEKLQLILLAYDNNKAIACAALKPINEMTAEIARVYTEEEYRGRGIAKILINEIIEYAKENGYKELILDTWKTNTAAKTLYEKLGFIEMEAFDIDKLKKSFSISDEDKLKGVKQLLIFMKKDIY